MNVETPLTVTGWTKKKNIMLDEDEQNIVITDSTAGYETEVILDESQFAEEEESYEESITSTSANKHV